MLFGTLLGVKKWRKIYRSMEKGRESVRREREEEYRAWQRYGTLLLNEKLKTLLSECNISTDSFGGNISSSRKKKIQSNPKGEIEN